MMQIRKIFFTLVAILTGLTAGAQATRWPSPEVEKMYLDARELHSRGNLEQAITMYLQALNIAPDVMILYRDLGQAYHLSGAHEQARQTLEPVIKNNAADAATYQTMAAALMALREEKKARRTLEDGIGKYPNAGILYHDLGIWHERDRDLEDALETWLLGIDADPAYHVNYYEAARAYMYANHPPVWTIIYAEIFINIEQQTARSYEARKMLLEAYKKLFNSVRNEEPPKFRGRKDDNQEQSFEKAVYDTYMKLAPVVRDGMDPETLTMLRTRFIMDWAMMHAKQYPFSLFYRMDKMIRYGYFDIYNQWLFGKVDNPHQFEAWKEFHPDDLPDFEEWLGDNSYRPVAGDFYNTIDLKGVFR